jgi:hypothetical protein
MSTDDYSTSRTEPDIVREITERVQAELPALANDLRGWFEAHRAQPREVSASSDPEGNHTIRLWLVTDDTGHDDGSSRVVYDPSLKTFGLLMEMQNGVSWYMGSYGSLVDTVSAI